MKIVVTGASGFLGSALMRQFAKMGTEAVGVTRQAVPGLVQVASYADAPVGDVLVHLAEASDRAFAQAHAPTYADESLDILNALMDKGYSRIVYSSSAVLYGDSAKIPSRIDSPIYEADAYTRLKCAAEKLVLSRGGIVARMVNLYGPGMAENNVLSTILQQIETQGPVRVWDTAPVRDFLWVDDAAAVLARMAVSSHSGVFNVGSGKGVSVSLLAKEVLKAAGQEDRLVECTRPSGVSSYLVVDAKETEKIFDWCPTRSLADGLAVLVKMSKKDKA